MEALDIARTDTHDHSVICQRLTQSVSQHSLRAQIERRGCDCGDTEPCGRQGAGVAGRRVGEDRRAEVRHCCRRTRRRPGARGSFRWQEPLSCDRYRWTGSGLPILPFHRLAAIPLSCIPLIWHAHLGTALRAPAAKSSLV